VAKPYQVVLRPAALRDLKKIPVQDLRKLDERIRLLAENPRPPGYKKLQSPDNLLRVRVGDYRVVYQVSEKPRLVTVIRIGNRSEVYRGF
jgi:mRNA interferase RelE/StbE